MQRRPTLLTKNAVLDFMDKLLVIYETTPDMDKRVSHIRDLRLGISSVKSMTEFSDGRFAANAIIRCCDFGHAESKLKTSQFTLHQCTHKGL